MNSDNLVGITLGNRYDMLEKIGTGGMATVYKAKDTLLNRYVAIKILRDSLEGEEQVVSNFIKEAQSSASLVHNNIVSVYDVGEENGLNYMVMEYVDGITLKEYIKQKGALPWQEACDFAIQIGQGISEAHSINIIHRDIKPQNILMTKDKTLKVTDFGIARAVAGETTVVGGSALGSVHYISPEQARGGFTDARSDIYSLGIVLYEMLTGKVPFDGDTPVSVALMHLEKEPVNVKCVNLDIPTDLAYVTMKAISKEQSNRYQNVQEFVDDLHAVLADEPLPSRDDVYEEVTPQEDYAYDDESDFDDNLDVPETVEEEEPYEEELPARREEVEHAKEEGIIFKLLNNPVEILGDENEFVTGMKCVEMELGEPDESGRRRPVVKPGSEFVLDVDAVVISIGTSPNPLIKATTKGLETQKWGGIITDEHGLTSREGVYAGGDAVTGAATVILAMGAGKTAAAAIDEYIKSKE